jgi:putative nucleotidyltransferase with HDIG domain
MIDRERICQLMGELSPLPQTAVRLAALLAQKNWSIDQCVEIVKYDQALTAGVLKYANAASEAPRCEVTEVRDGVIRLGGGRILEEVLRRHFRRDCTSALPSYGYDERDLWRHSVAAALAAEILSAHLTLSLGGLAFSAALLHDIGKLLLARAAPREDMEAVWAAVSRERCSCERAEKEVLGITHAEIGAEITRQWGLPESIVMSIARHHAVNDPADPMTDCVMVANVVARSIGEGIGYEGMSIGADATVGKRIGLSKEKLELVCSRTRARFQEVAEEFK